MRILNNLKTPNPHNPHQKPKLAALGAVVEGFVAPVVLQASSGRLSGIPGSMFTVPGKLWILLLRIGTTLRNQDD